MDLSIVSPDSGASPGASTAAPIHLPPEKAKKFFEAFRSGVFSVILLGDVEEQRFHFVKPSEEEKAKKIRGHMALCTASLGSCHHCRARLAGEVLIQESQPYHLGPAYVRKGDRGDFEQKVITLTDGMNKELCDQLGATGWRGHQFELRRETTQKYKIHLANKSHTLAQNLPPAFAVLPFVRARFELPQDPLNPLVFIPRCSRRELTAAAPERPKVLALTASDCRSAEEWEKTKAALDAMKEHNARRCAEEKAAVVANAMAGTGVKVEVECAVVEPAVEPEGPQPVPGTIKATVVEVIPGGVQTTEERLPGFPPEDYDTPKVLKAGATAQETNRLLNRGTGSIICGEQKERRKAAELGKDRGAAPASDSFDAILGTNGRKGGAK